MEKLEQTPVFPRGTKKLESDSSGVDGADHCSHLDRQSLLSDEDLQIKDLSDLHHRVASNDAAAHRDIDDRPFPLDAPA